MRRSLLSLLQQCRRRQRCFRSWGSVDLAKLHQVVPGHAVIRVMPNTPLAVGAGMTAIAPDSKVSSEMIDAAKTIFGSCGEVEVVAESAIEAITAVSGCGPGYVLC